MLGTLLKTEVQSWLQKSIMCMTLVFFHEVGGFGVTAVSFFAFTNSFLIVHNSSGRGKAHYLVKQQ
jgi:hypothetical protein